MAEGRRYALSRHGDHEPLQVTLISLSKPPRAGWVTVRLEEGLTAGRELEVSTRRILAEWEKRSQPRRARKPKPRKAVEDRPLRVGEKVCWPDAAGDLKWDLVSIEDGIARIEGQIFAQRQAHEVPVEALERAATSESQPPVLAEIEDQEEGEDEADEAEEVDAFADESDLDLPQDFVPKLMERAIFGPGLVDRYKARWAWKVSQVPAVKQLRRDILRRGKVIRRRRPVADEYVRIRVGQRYEVVVPDSPSQTEFITLKCIVPVRKPRRKKARRKPQKRGRRAA